MHNLSKIIQERINSLPLTKVIDNNDYSLFKIRGKTSGPVYLVGPSENSTIDKTIGFLNNSGLGPSVNDPNLKTQLIIKGLRFPTSMAFLGVNDILVLEKNNGTV